MLDFQKWQLVWEKHPDTLPVISDLPWDTSVYNQMEKTLGHVRIYHKRAAALMLLGYDLGGCEKVSSIISWISIHRKKDIKVILLSGNTLKKMRGDDVTILGGTQTLQTTMEHCLVPSTMQALDRVGGAWEKGVLFPHRYNPAEVTFRYSTVLTGCPWEDLPG